MKDAEIRVNGRGLAEYLPSIEPDSLIILDLSGFI